MTTAGGIAALLLAALGALHVAWAVLGVRNSSAALPEKDGAPLFVPRRSSTLGVAGLLSVAAVLVAMRAGLVPGLGTPGLRATGVWGVAAVLAARAIGDFRWVGFFKHVRSTRFATLDTLVYSPLVAALAAACAWVAWRGK